MESLAARNLAAMAISVYPIRSSSRKKRLRNEMGFPINTHSSCISTAFRVRCGGTSAGSKSCLALPVKEDFADEEDYVKAGGSELLFVQMQQNKNMDHQSKLSDKVTFFIPNFDLSTSVFLYFLIFFDFLRHWSLYLLAMVSCIHRI